MTENNYGNNTRNKICKIINWPVQMSIKFRFIDVIRMVLKYEQAISDSEVASRKKKA